MSKKINITQSFLPPFEEYTQLINRLWDTKHLTNRGEYVIKLENKLQDYLSSKSKPLLVCNGTLALQLAIKALDLKGEVITTPFSYIATTSALIWENCQPIFVDIHPEYLTIDETKVEAAITINTSAILATHVYGNPCNVEAIDRIAKKHKLKVIYDAAHCFGVTYKGKSIFDYGDISTCSFHATKIFHTGEGGAVFCDDLKLSEKLFSAHNFGHEGPEQIVDLGINGKMNDLSAAMGLSILPHMGKVIMARKKIAGFYNDNLNYTKLGAIKIRNGTDWNCSYYPVLFKNEECLLRVRNKLNNNLIFPRRYFYPSLNKLDYISGNSMEISEEISRRILCLPIYPSLKSIDQEKIRDLINSSI